MHFVKEADFNISDIKIKKMAALFGHKVETERGEEDYVLPENSQSAGLPGKWRVANRQKGM